jgi:D-alanine-D-alanine ligase
VSGRGVADALLAAHIQVEVLELNFGIGEALRDAAPDVVFPVLHGPPGEDGTFQGFLETLGIAYVGSGVHASACAMDKALAKHLFRDAGLVVARDMVIRRNLGARAAARKVMLTLGQNVVVKPTRQGSALGVRFPSTSNELEAAIDEAFGFDERVLVEERIAGREITVAIIERDLPEALPVIEVCTPAGSWYDFAHRYTAGLSEHVIPAPLPAAQYQQTQETAKLAHVALGCRDLSRADFVVPVNGEPVLLEVNTLPGMTPTSLYPDAARAAGISFEQLVEILVKRALARVSGA